ncbi:MAG: hypothetical protein IJJ90_07985 [Prevotella sp.]|nr:hypothetical protein [Prevotella sp.]
MAGREIMSRIVSHGNAAAFSEVVRRCSSVLYSKTLGVVKRTDVAQDIVQQAFCKAYQGLDTWRGERLGGVIFAPPECNNIQAWLSYICEGQRAKAFPKLQDIHLLN